MLKSYEAHLEHGEVKWLKDQPQIPSARVIVTILEETSPPLIRRAAPSSIAGKGQTLGDLVSPFISEQEWECLK